MTDQRSPLRASPTPLRESEALPALSNRHQEFVSERLGVRICREVERVEARVRRGQTELRVCAVSALEREFLRAALPPQIPEPAERHLACACNKHEQTRAVLLVEGAHGVPEPLHELVCRAEATVFSVRAEVCEVDGGQAREKQFKFVGGKNRDERRGNQLLEAFEKGVQLVDNLRKGGGGRGGGSV